MIGDIFINSKDAYSTWGVSMGDGFIDAIDSFNELKGFVENESRLENGKRVITANPKIAARQLSLQFTIRGDSETDYRVKKKNFQKELEKGLVTIKIPSLGEEVYKLVYTGKNIAYGMSLNRRFGKVSMKFEEPNPADRAE